MQSAIAEYQTIADASPERISYHLAAFSPFIIHSVAVEHVSTATPSPFCDLNTYLAEDVKDCCVQVSVAPRGQPFSGDPLNACTVEMRLEEFMLNYQAHGARSELSLYLSQCPIVSNEPEIPALLPQLAHLARLPDELLQPEDVLRVNLWISTDATHTTTHYDANHNFLHVHEGQKKVTLIPPSLTHLLKPHPSWSASANHASISMEELDMLKRSNDGRDRILEVVVSKNGLLFIPEGWWHQVDSEPRTIAVNYWFKSPLYALLNNPNLTPYVLRAAIHRAVDHRTEEDLHTAQRVGTAASSEGSIPWLRALTTGRTTEALNRMAEALARFARDQPAEWTKLLLVEADPLTVELLTSAWEAAQVHGVIDDAFFAVVFEACGDQADDVRVRLIEQKDKHRQLQAAKVLCQQHGV